DGVQHVVWSEYNEFASSFVNLIHGSLQAYGIEIIQNNSLTEKPSASEIIIGSLNYTCMIACFMRLLTINAHHIACHFCTHVVFRMAFVAAVSYIINISECITLSLGVALTKTILGSTSYASIFFVAV
ncbi:hypothetical protein ACJX0J_029217, partial [Zea mays]